MLGEIIELTKFAVEFIRDRQAQSGGWSKVYLLYVSLGEVIDKSEFAINAYLPVPLNAPFLVNTRHFSSPIEKWVTLTNDDFGKLNKAVLEFMKAFREVAEVLEIYDAGLKKKIEFHIKWKSLWYDKFVELYASGQLQSDGKKLCRRWLKLAEKITDELEDPWLTWEDVAERFLLEELIDISTEDKRSTLVELGRRNVEELKRARSQLAAFIRQNCKIEDLL